MSGAQKFDMNFSLHLVYDLALHPMTEHHEVMLLPDGAKIPRSLFLQWSGIAVAFPDVNFCMMVMCVHCKIMAPYSLK